MKPFKKRLLFLGASRYQKNCIEKAKKLGFEVFAIDRNPNAAGFRSADRFEAVDIADEEAALRVAARNRINGVLAFNDFGVRTAAYICGKMRLPGLDCRTARIATDKAAMRKRWAEKSVPIPDFFVAASFEEAKAKMASSSMKFPLVVKPADSRGGGSRGVRAVFDIRDFKDAFDFAQKAYPDKRVIIERCVRGTEHSVEAVVIKGQVHILAVSEKEKTPYPYRVDKKVIYPAGLSGVKLGQLKEAVKKAIQAVGITDGVAHVELAITKEGPVLFEIGARCGGGATPEIVERLTGIPYFKIALQLALGEEVHSSDISSKYEKAAMYDFFTFKPGKLRKIMGVERLGSIREIVDFELFIKSGDTINEVRKGPDRHGFAVIIANDKSRLSEVSRKIDDLVYCEYEGAVGE